MEANEVREHGNYKKILCPKGRISHSASLCRPTLVSGWLFTQTSTLLLVNYELFEPSSSQLSLPLHLELEQKTNIHDGICTFETVSLHPVDFLHVLCLCTRTHLLSSEQLHGHFKKQPRRVSVLFLFIKHFLLCCLCGVKLKMRLSSCTHHYLGVLLHYCSECVEGIEHA